MRTERRVPDLLSDLINNLSTLFRQELRLAQVEAAENVEEATGAIAYLAAGALVALAGLVLLLHSASAWLMWMGLEGRWSTLVVGLVAGLVGLVLALKGRRDISATSVTPSRTLNQLRRDVGVAREQVQ